jgi:hypothetical protein
MAAAQWALNQDALISRERSLWSKLSEQPPVTDAAEAALKQPRVTEAAEPALKQPVAIAAERRDSLRAFSMLTSFYSIRTPIAVEQFLREHKFLLSLLFAAFPRINFALTCEPELSLVDDPEGGITILLVRLRSARPDAYEALSRFDNEWWLDHIRDAHGLLNFVLRPQ